MRTPLIRIGFPRAGHTWDPSWAAWSSRRAALLVATAGRTAAVTICKTVRAQPATIPRPFDLRRFLSAWLSRTGRPPAGPWEHGPHGRPQPSRPHLTPQDPTPPSAPHRSPPPATPTPPHRA